MNSKMWRKAARASERMAIAVTAAVISPWSFWLLFSLCLLQFVSAKVATGVLYISNDIQLVLLPLLGISSSVSARSADRRAKRNHEVLMKAVAVIEQRLDRLLALMGTPRPGETGGRGASQREGDEHV